LNTEQILATDFCNGSTHDFQLFKESGSAMSPQICALADSGYQGLAALHSNSQTPAKKTKLHPLSKEQKDRNRAISKERILIENIIRKLKIFRILSERYRNRRKRFGLRFNLIAAIYNLELKKALERTYARGLMKEMPMPNRYTAMRKGGRCVLPFYRGSALQHMKPPIRRYT
jgi:transposase